MNQTETFIVIGSTSTTSYTNCGHTIDNGVRKIVLYNNDTKLYEIVDNAWFSNHRIEVIGTMPKADLRNATI